MKWNDHALYSRLAARRGITSDDLIRTLLAHRTDAALNTAALVQIEQLWGAEFFSPAIDRWRNSSERSASRLREPTMKSLTNLMWQKHPEIMHRQKRAYRWLQAMQRRKDEAGIQQARRALGFAAEDRRHAEEAIRAEQLTAKLSQLGDQPPVVPAAERSLP